MSVFHKISNHSPLDLRSSIAMSFESAQAEMLTEQQEVDHLNGELQKTIQVKQAVELVSDSLDPNDANYGVAMEAIFIAAGLSLPVELLAPSFEAEDKKEDAGEKKKNFVGRAWEAIKAFFKKLWDGFLRLIDRKKEIVEKVAEVAEEMASDRPAETNESEQSKTEETAKETAQERKPRGVHGKATLAGKTSVEYAENAPRIMKEFASGYEAILEKLDKMDSTLNSRSVGPTIKTADDALRHLGLTGHKTTIRGAEGAEYSMEFKGEGRKVKADIVDKTPDVDVFYEPLDRETRKKLGVEMKAATSALLPILGKMAAAKKDADRFMGMADQIVGKFPDAKEVVEIGISIMSAFVVMYNSDPTTKISKTLITIRTSGRKKAA